MHTQQLRATTIVAVRGDGVVALGGDGQVTLGDTVVKSSAKKVRVLKEGEILGGFAGAVADAFTLFERLEEKLERFPANLTRAVVELAKDWRTDRYLRRLDALLVVADREHLFLVSGQGEVIEPDDDIVAIGSGGSYALAAARALRYPARFIKSRADGEPRERASCRRARRASHRRPPRRACPPRTHAPSRHRGAGS